jgi:hypothetical protein
MLDRFLPARIEPTFPGHAGALWILGFLAVMRMVLGLVHILRADGGLQQVSHVPLDSYPIDAAQNLVALTARMGLEQFLFGLVLLIVLVRYRGLVPLMYLLFVLGYLSTFALAQYKPLVTSAPSDAGPIHLFYLTLGVVGLMLCLAPQRAAPGSAEQP